MDTITAFAMGAANQGKPLMVFDWIKAARIIAKEKPSCVRAGLRGDWEWTGGTIYKNGICVWDSYTYLASTWAKPEIEVDGELRDCFVMQSECKWGSDTKWPDEAIALLDCK